MKFSRPWIFLLNPFLIATNKNYALALSLSNYHYHYLDAVKDTDPELLAMFNAYQPYHDFLSSSYVVWEKQQGSESGDVKSVTALLNKMTVNLKAWDYIIEGVYPKDSVKYKKLFPKGHYPFQNGAQELRVKAVDALINQIGTDAALAAVKATISAYYLLLKIAYDLKETSVKSTGTDSTSVETARVAMCEEQYGNLGFLMTKYKRTPLLTEPFFDMAIVRNHQQKLFTKIIKPTSVYKIAKRKLNADAEIICGNPGTTDMLYYRGLKKNSLPGIKFIKVSPGDTAKPTSADLGEGDFILAYNPDTLIIGICKITLP